MAISRQRDFLFHNGRNLAKQQRTGKLLHYSKPFVAVVVVVVAAVGQTTSQTASLDLSCCIASVCLCCCCATICWISSILLLYSSSATTHSLAQILHFFRRTTAEARGRTSRGACANWSGGAGATMGTGPATSRMPRRDAQPTSQREEPRMAT
eukprot:3160164-Amphidinium_carterae.1